MLLPATEMLSDNEAIDLLTADRAASVFVAAQAAALQSVLQASPDIARGAKVMASAVRFLANTSVIGRCSPAAAS